MFWSEKSNDFTWDEYFMSICIISSYRSKDPSRKVGCCLIEKNSNKILAIGYNGFPRGCHDSKLPWQKDDVWLNTKYPYVCHAEANAILNANSSLKNSVAYVTLFPCNECAKLMIQSGISEVVYTEHQDNESTKAATHMFSMAGLKVRHFTPRYSTTICKNCHTS